MQVIWESISVLFVPPTKDTASLYMWCIFLAVLFAWLYLSTRRKTVGKAAKVLLEKECTSPETALTQAELGGLSPKAISSPDHLIEKVEKEGEDPRFYIPPQRLKKAQYYLKASTFRWWQEVLCILGIYLALVILYYLVPGLLKHFGIYL